MMKGGKKSKTAEGSGGRKPLLTFIQGMNSTREESSGLATAIHEFREHFYNQEDKQGEFEWLSQATPEKSKKEKYELFRFSKACGLLAAKGVVVDLNTNYVIGVEVDKKLYLFSSEYKKFKESDLYRVNKDKDSRNVVIALSGVALEYPDNLKGSVDRSAVDNGLLQLFKESLYKDKETKKIKAAFDIFLLMIVEPARCIGLEKQVLKAYDQY